MKTRLRLPLFTFLLTLLCLGFSSDGWGQTVVINFDDVAKWTAGSAAIGSYASNHTYVDENWTFTGGPALRNTTAVQDGFPGALGTYSWRLQDNASVNWRATYNQANTLETFGFAVRRWDGSPSPNFSIEYSINGGVSYTSTGVIINNAYLDNSSNWKTFSFTFPTPVTVAAGDFVVKVAALGSTERIMIDNFSFTLGIITEPLLSVTPSTLSDLDYIEGNGPSPSQSFELSGVNLDGSDVDLVLPALNDFEISVDNTDFFDSLNFTSYDGATTIIYVRLKAGLGIDEYSEDITISGGGADPVTVALAGEVEPAPIPTLIATPTTLTNLNYMFGNGPSAAQNFVLSGEALDGSNVNITVPAQFEISADNVNFSGSLLLSAYDGSNTTIYVRLVAGLSENNYTGDADIEGGSAAPISVGLEGNVTPFIDQYNGNGVFKKISSVSELTDGYYVILNETSEFIMTSNRDGTPETGFYISDDAIVSNEIVVNPSTANVWQIGINGSGRTIYNEVIERYVGWISGNAASAEETVADRTRWTFTYMDGKFTVNNVETSIRQLSYNSGAPRFAAYGNAGQQELQLYKFIIADYTYQDGVWTPESPVGESTETDDILIINGIAMFDQSMEMNNLYVLSDASLDVEDVLTINGNIYNDGAIVFKSTSITDTAQLDTFTGSITGSGEVTIERFIPARRAFRFLSSAVTTSGTINANWQEGAINATNNPNPEYGTHITGSTTGANGFDATPSGNPSLFMLNNTAQAWEAVTNTDVNTIAAGTPYRILVRGDRSVDVTSNNAPPTNTTLRTTGTLHTGSFSATNLSAVENEFNFFGNPYPAAVDMNLVIAASANVNPSSYLIWDPNLGTRGAYVVVDLPEGTNPSGSQANQFLQPGQAAFVNTLADGPASLQFIESHKNVAAPLTAVFNVQSKIDLRLYNADAFTAGSTPSDGLRFKFGEDNTNTLTSMDAPKFFNQDENLASFNDDRLWSIESRFTPQVGEVLPLFTNQYRTTDYVFEAEVSSIEGVTAYLRDIFTGEEVLLANDETGIYAFSIDAGNPNSSANDRFEIVFGEEILGTNNNVFGNGFVLYPNPVQNENFFIATRGLEGQNVTVEVYSMLGQLLVTETPQVPANGRLSVAVPQLPAGVFTVTLTAKDGSRFTTKLINQ